MQTPSAGRFVTILVAVLLASHAVMAQTTAFTYQGKLSDSGSPAGGQYDLQFTLFDALSGGTQQGITQTVASVSVSNGIFTVQLDFGACASCFDGSARFLEIAVKKTTDTTYTTLAPRQPISSTPYALRRLNATAADGLSVACMNCITSSQIASVNGSAITGTIPAASLPAGSGNVGIGTSIPSRKLTVLTPSGNVGIAHTDGTAELVTLVGLDGIGVLTGFLGTSTSHPLSLFANSQRGLTIETNGLVRLDHFSNQGTTAMCFTATFEVGFCSSSLRYKTNLAPYGGGMEIVNRLRPISFDWKQGGIHDVGFGAEEVEQISPLLVTYNQAGQVEGVKYDRLSVVFVNAIKEQQALIGNQQQEIGQLKSQIVTQQTQLDALKQLVCMDHPGADLCR